MATKLKTHALNVMCPNCHREWDRDPQGPRTSWCLSCAPSPLAIPKS